jgi:hypothetical protein
MRSISAAPISSAARSYSESGEQHLSDGKNLQLSDTQSASGTVDVPFRDVRSVFSLGYKRGEHMSKNESFEVGESTALLHAIFPRYPDLLGMRPSPDVDGFLLQLRAQSSLTCEPGAPIPTIGDHR